MGKILEYNDLGGPPNVNDLLFIGDYNESSTNPTTKHVSITNLNKKYQIWAADGGGLKITDDGGNYGLFIKDGGNVGVGTNSPERELDVLGGTADNSSTTIRIGGSTNHTSKIELPERVDSGEMTYGFSLTTDGGSAGGSTNNFLLRNHENSAVGNVALIVQRSDGNVGVGVASPAANLDVAGDFRILDGTFGVAIDASLADIHGLKTSGSASGPLHLNRNAGEDIWFMYGDGSDFAGKIESSNKRWSIGTVLSAGARLHIKEITSGTTPALRLETYQASGTVRTVQQFTQTIGATSLHQYLVWDGTQLGIRATNAALGTDSVNFSAGKIALGGTTFTRKFNVTDSSNIVANFNSSDNNGTKILIRNTSNAAAAVQHSLIAFPNKIGSNEIANWMTGAYKDNANPDNNYFMIHYSSQTAPTDGQYVFDTTTTNNAMRLDTSGNVRFKGTMEASAYYDQGGNTAGNYCRGRFLQTFSLPYYADELNRFSPLLAVPFDRTDDTAGSTITAKFASVAPHDGRVQSFRASAKNNQAATTNCDLYIYTGASLPSGTELGDGDSAKVASDNSQLQLASLANQKITLGYDDFSNKTRLDFSQGDYLIFSIDTDSGNAHINIDITVEFYIDDTL